MRGRELVFARSIGALAIGARDVRVRDRDLRPWRRCGRRSARSARGERGTCEDNPEHVGRVRRYSRFAR
jgi:hypothetical protein